MTNHKIQTIRVDYHNGPINLGLIRRDIDKYNSFVESLRAVAELNGIHGTSASLIRPEVADDILTRGGYLWLLKEYSPFAVGAIVAHEERDFHSYKSKPFSDKVRYYAYDVSNSVSRSVELVTGRFKGETDSALVVIKPTLDDLTININDKNHSKDITINVSDERIQQVTDFPSKCGWYEPNELAIPTGEEVEESRDARYLVRFQKPVRHGGFAWDAVIQDSGTYVGLIFRSALPEEEFYTAGKGIVMAPVDTKGIIVEIPDEDLEKLIVEIPDEDLEKLVEKSIWRKFVEFFR